MPFLNEDGLNLSRRQRCQGFCTEGLLCAWSRSSSSDGDDAAKAGGTARYRRRIGDVRSGMCELVTRTTTTVVRCRVQRGEEDSTRVHHQSSVSITTSPGWVEPNVRTTHSGWQAVADHRAEADGQRLPVSRSIRPIRLVVPEFRRVRTHPAPASPAALLTCRPRPT